MFFVFVFLKSEIGLIVQNYFPSVVPDFLFCACEFRRWTWSVKAAAAAEGLEER